MKKLNLLSGTKLCLKAIGVLVLVGPIQEALAQIEEIVVTSRRYEERITDAPLAVAVMNDEYLEENRVYTIQDVLDLTPGSNWGQFAKAQPGLSMRGIWGGSFGNASLEHAVSVVADGMPITKAFMMTLPVYDLQRAEVLRGPQGTTFGRNATLGMMHFISARPDEETFGDVEASLGDRGLREIRGHFNGALSDNLIGRIAYNYSDIPGSMESAAGDAFEFEEYSETRAVRASLAWDASDTLTGYFKAEFIKDEEFPTVRRGADLDVQWLNANYGSFVSSADPWEASLSPEPSDAPWIVERDMMILTAEFVKDLDNDLSLTSITGYADGDHYSNSDAFGTPYDIRDQLVWNDANIFSQEVRLDNQASSDRVRWLVGASYLTDEEDRVEKNESEPLRNNCNFVDPSGCPRNSILFTEALNTTDAWGIFGEVTFDISDQLTLAVGGRYSSDSRDLDFSTYGYGAAGGLGGIGLGSSDPTRDCADPASQYDLDGVLQCGTEANPVGFDGFVSESWSDFSPKVSLRYAVNDNSNFYMLYSQGFKAGGFQQDARTASNLDVILDAENAENIEFGWKGSFDSFVGAVTVFRQEQTDVHTGNLVVVGSSQANLLVNAEGIKNIGVELEGTWAVTDNLEVGGMISSYKPEFKEGSQIAATFDASTGNFLDDGEDVSGTVPANSIDFASYVYVSYDWELAGGSTMSIRGDYRHRGDTWGQNGANNRQGRNLNDDGFMYLNPAQNKTGLRLSWTSADDAWGVSVWGRNLDDKPSYLNYGPPFGYVYLAGPGDPSVRARAVGSTGRRQVGATVNYTF